MKEKFDSSSRIDALTKFQNNIERVIGLMTVLSGNAIKSDKEEYSKILLLLQQLQTDVEDTINSVKAFEVNKYIPKEKRDMDITNITEKALLLYTRRSNEIFYLISSPRIKDKIKEHTHKSIDEEKLFEDNKKIPLLEAVFKPCFSQEKAEYRFSKTKNTKTSSDKILQQKVTSIGKQIKNEKSALDMAIKRNQIKILIFPFEDKWITRQNRSLAAASISEIEPRIVLIAPDKKFINYYIDKMNNKSPDNTIILEHKSEHSARKTKKVTHPTKWMSLFNVKKEEKKKKSTIKESESEPAEEKKPPTTQLPHK
ncbi:hypothetical protein [Legionella sainthelensi]|uniref:hypothetical protein n=1 Tax=Legionella sainthelensi TaxID=28087 RepID=UPI000E20B517|nr:hypothetical protein [Legionella sainthelensi]